MTQSFSTGRNRRASFMLSAKNTRPDISAPSRVICRSMERSLGKIPSKTTASRTSKSPLPRSSTACCNHFKITLRYYIQRKKLCAILRLFKHSATQQVVMENRFLCLCERHEKCSGAKAEAIGRRCIQEPHDG